MFSKENSSEDISFAQSAQTKDRTMVFRFKKENMTKYQIQKRTLTLVFLRQVTGGCRQAMFLFPITTISSFMTKLNFSDFVFINLSPLVRYGWLLSTCCLFMWKPSGASAETSSERVLTCSHLTEGSWGSRHGCIFFPKILIFPCRKSLSFPGSGQRPTKILIFP